MPELEPRFWSKVDIREWDECWPWTAATSSGGYGRFSIGGTTRRLVQAHRVAYELLVGPIPEGLELDHVRAWGCVHRDCCNPLHLEPVTTIENLRRGQSPTAVNGRKTHCVNGHEFNIWNTLIVIRNGRPGRDCRACGRDRKRRSRTRRQP